MKDKLLEAKEKVTDWYANTSKTGVMLAAFVAGIILGAIVVAI